MEVIQIVDKHQESYKNKNLEDLIETMDEQIEVFDLNGNLTYKGIQEAKKRYKELFNNVGEIQMYRQSRIIQEKYVIDKLRIIGVRANPVEFVEISLVENQKITKKWYIM